MKRKVIRPILAVALTSMLILSMGACTSSKEKKLAKSFHDISAYDTMISELLEDMENATFAEGKLGTFAPFQDKYSELMDEYEAMEKDVPEELMEYYNATKNYIEAFETAGLKLELLYQFGHSDIDLSEVKIDQTAINIMQAELVSKYGFKKKDTSK